MDWSRKPSLHVVRSDPSWEDRQRQGCITRVELTGDNLAQQEARILAHQQRIGRELAARKVRQVKSPSSTASARRPHKPSGVRRVKPQPRPQLAAVAAPAGYQDRLALRARHQEQLAQFLLCQPGHSARFRDILKGLDWTHTTLSTAAVGHRFHKYGGRVALLESKPYEGDEA